MGQKVSPLALRLGYIKNWHSVWFASKNNFAKFIYEDSRIRKFIKKTYRHASIAAVNIERLGEKIRIKILTARPGVIIGRHGSEIDKLRQDIDKIAKREITIDIEEVKEPYLDAALVAENITFQIEKRVAHRRAIKRAIERTIAAGAIGIRVTISGRLGGAEMKRSETYKQGKIPLQTFRADIDYALAEAFTTYGIIGIKVWIYKGDIIKIKQTQVQSQNQSEQKTTENKEE